jgi:hypothetical protein
MTPIGHYAIGMTAGTVVWKLSGSPVAGGIVALLAHIPADLLFNEFYEWGADKSVAIFKKLKLVTSLLPAIFLLVVCALETGSFIPVVFGALGCLMDLDDLYKAFFGYSIIPCHPGSPFYIPALWFNNWEPKMQTISMTALWESVLTLISVLTVLILK